MANRPDIQPPPDHRAKAASLLAETAANSGLAPVDLERFWADQSHSEPFAPSSPQCPLGVAGMSGECVWDELGIPEDYYRYQHEPVFRRDLNIAYNNLAEKIVGRRLLDEKLDDPTLHYPPVKMLPDLFEAKNVWHDWSWWLQQSANSEDELAALLDRVDARLASLDTLRAFMLPPNWDAEKKRLTDLGIKPPLYRGQRGPCTFATSIFGTENTLMLVLDNPTLAIRLRDTILRAMLGIARVLDLEAGYTPQTAPHGFGFWDDNCCLFNPEMYELFGYPILQGIFDVYSPDLADNRFQHSDSPMAHLLALLGRLNLTGTNFGPTVTVQEIRRHLPRAVIDGQLAPYTFSNNEHERMICEFLRDFDASLPARGLRFSTAGSINNGSRLTSLRLLMSTVQHFGRY